MLSGEEIFASNRLTVQVAQMGGEVHGDLPWPLSERSMSTSSEAPLGEKPIREDLTLCGREKRYLDRLTGRIFSSYSGSVNYLGGD